MNLNDLLITWYMWLSSLNAALSEPVRLLTNGLDLPILSALLFGILGTTAPCQLSTNFGALTFLARQPGDRPATLRATLAYIAAKMLVYTLLGGAVLLAGQQLSALFVPYIVWARQIIGPLMIVLGLAVLGVIRVRWQVGQGVAARLERAATAGPGGEAVTRARRPAPAGAPAGPPAPGPAAAEPAAPGPGAGFLLGLAFSCAFCPTLFLLFFGVTLTLAARSPAGLAFPAVFALGTALPLLLFVALALSSAGAAQRFLRRVRRANRPLRRLGGAFLILLGLHDTLVYWFL
jgi:cytochrome c biogenesis protein CcdA